MQVTYTNVKPLIEALKEAGRIALLAVVPVLIEQLSENRFEWQAILVIAALAVLKAIDKFMHLTGKLDDNAQLTKGITQF